MIKLLKALFEPRPTLPAHVHLHIDESGREVLCDESACRPAPESPLISALLAPPVR